MYSKIYSGNFHPFLLLLLLIPLLLASEAYPENGVGYLWVTSQPDYALIYVDGRYTNAMTPTSKLLSFSPGRHRLEVSKQGYKLYEDWVTIESARVLEINVIFASSDSTEDSKLASKRHIEVYMTIKSRPSGADVYLDDEYLGKTPVMSRAVQAGEPKDRKLRIEKPGHKTHEETIGWMDIRNRIKTQISVELEQVEEVVEEEPPVEPEPIEPQEDTTPGGGKRFVISTQVIVLLIVLIVMIAVLIARMIIRTHQRTGGD